MERASTIIHAVLLALVAVMSIRAADRELRTFTHNGGVYVVEADYIDAVRLAALCRGDSAKAAWYVAVMFEGVPTR